jgi:hypothetical protein
MVVPKPIGRAFYVCIACWPRRDLATNRTVVYDDGKVTDANGDDIGNILDEVQGDRAG